MFFQFMYSGEVGITALFGWGFNMYWKAADIVKMFYFKNTGITLKKYLPNEYMFRYENESDVTVFLDSLQVLRFMDNIYARDHRNDSFKRWFKQVVNGTLSFSFDGDLSEFSSLLNYPENFDTITLHSVSNDRSRESTTDTLTKFVYTLPEIVSNVRKRNLPFKMQSVM